jgi:hypothetical protein
MPDRKSIVRWILFGILTSSFSFCFIISNAIKIIRGEEIFLVLVTPTVTLLIGSLGFLSGIFIVVIKVVEILETLYDRLVTIDQKIK